MIRPREPVWVCPECGAPLAGKNLWHSCGRWSLDHHFASRPPRLRELFDRFRVLVERCGPVTLIPQKTRIVFCAEVRFAGATIRAGHIRPSLWMPYRVDDWRVLDASAGNHGTWYHHFRIERLEDLDARFAEWVREAYLVGCRRHLPER